MSIKKAMKKQNNIHTYVQSTVGINIMMGNDNSFVTSCIIIHMDIYLRVNMAHNSIYILGTDFSIHSSWKFVWSFENGTYIMSCMSVYTVQLSWCWSTSKVDFNVNVRVQFVFEILLFYCSIDWQTRTPSIKSTFALLSRQRRHNQFLVSLFSLTVITNDGVTSPYAESAFGLILNWIREM